MIVTLKNCNNVEFGEIEIQENKLNVKYALNGTGKSTIAKAMLAFNDEKKLNELVPFKHRGTSTVKPEISGIPEGANFAVFNEDYVNQYVFLPDELVKNSFEIFIKDENYENNQIKIESLISEIKKLFDENSSINSLLTVMQGFSDNFKATKTGFSGAGVLGKGLARGNKLVHIPQGLKKYEPFLKSTNNVKWLEWQISGQGYMDVADCCPFCSDDKISTKKTMIDEIKKEYEPQYVKHLNSMLQLLDNLGVYLSSDAQQKIDLIRSNVSDITAEQKEYLNTINTQIELLKKKLLDMKGLSYFSFKSVDDVETLIRSYKIDIQFLTEMNSSKTSDEVTLINTAIDSIINKIGKLKAEISKQNQLVIKRIAKYKQEINDFLKYAGYVYLTTIEEQQNGEYKLFLRHKDFESTISNGKTTLSFGERNAFALVLFMYEVVKKNPSLIILDDPISSFDGNKKFAILNMLFMGSGNLNNKTVLLLTHEFSSIIDIKKNMSDKFQANAHYLSNKKGLLIEKAITKRDVVSYKQIAVKNIASLDNEVSKIIYLRRLYEFEDEKDLGYQVLSNIFKKRTPPKFMATEVDRDMTEEELHIGCEQIVRLIPEFTYDRILSKVSDTQDMINLYKSLQIGYEKLQVYRIINNENNENDVVRKFVNETFHIENDYLFQLNPCEYEIIPDYIINECDLDIERIQAKITEENGNE